MADNENNYLTVTELNTYIKQIFDAEDLLHRICVIGEVSGFSIRGQHAYFTLKDENSQMRCCCFNFKKTYTPADGELILAGGSLDFYLKGGYVSFNVNIMEPYGKGLLAIKLEELKKKLSEQGYFDASHKKAIPAFCQNIAVITSKDGAVIKDICRTIRAKNDVTNIDIFDVKVQGIGCADTIIRALKRVDKMGYDTIIIARGGGSFEDLMGFNDERLVYSIFDAKTPIISAVGHETDFTLCDFVADLRVPTPTAAGELIAYDIKAMRRELADNIIASYDAIKDKYINLAKNFKNIASLMLTGVENKKLETGVKLRLLSKDLVNAVNNKTEGFMNAISAYAKILNASSPLRILERGFVEMRDNKGAFIDGIAKLNVNERITLKGKDGSAEAEIISINKE